MNRFFSPIFLFLLFFSFCGPALAEDCWLSVSGNGLMNGKDSSNAYPSKKAQKCWDQTSANGIMHVMEGNYSKQENTFWSLIISKKTDGEPTSDSKSFKKLVGEGKVIMTGTRPIPYKPATKEAGERWITFLKGANRVVIDNFHVSQVAEGITLKGSNKHLRFYNLHFQDTRQNITVIGNPHCNKLSACDVKPEEISQDIIVKNTSGLRYSKRHIRLTRGVFNVRVLNSTADAEFLDEDFSVGFDVENPSHDIEFNHCISRRNIFSLSSYWNGDGFKSEDETRNIRWKNCAAFDNADGGFDIKTPNAILENVIAFKNTRNIRIWSPKKSTIRNANASFSKHHGGESTEAGLWTQGVVDCHSCTLYNNKIQAHTENNGAKARIHFYDSIISMTPDIQGETFRQEDGTDITLTRSYVQKNEQNLPPSFRPEANADWQGGNTAFNSLTYGKSKGYYYE